MGDRGSRTARALMVIGCLWLAVGGLAIAAQLGLRFAIDQLPPVAEGDPDIARIVLEPVRDVLLPILVVALVIGALVQTIRMLVSLLRRRGAAS